MLQGLDTKTVMKPPQCWFPLYKRIAAKTYHVGQPKSVETQTDNTTHSTSKQRVIYPSHTEAETVINSKYR